MGPEDGEATMPTAEEVAQAMRVLEQVGAVRRVDGEWIHEADVDAQEEAERLLATQIGRERARRLIERALEETAVETPPRPK